MKESRRFDSKIDPWRDSCDILDARMEKDEFSEMGSKNFFLTLFRSIGP